MSAREDALGVFPEQVEEAMRALVEHAESVGFDPAKALRRARELAAAVPGVSYLDAVEQTKKEIG